MKGSQAPTFKIFLSVRRPCCPLDALCQLGAAVLGPFFGLFRGFIPGGPGETFDYGVYRRAKHPSHGRPSAEIPGAVRWMPFVRWTAFLSLGCLLSVGR